MRLSTRLAAHIRGNVVGYVALFVALSGGAYAFSVAPKNSVTSRSIRNGQVRKPDLANGAVNGPKVAPDSLGGAAVNESLLGPVPNALNLGGSPASAFLKGSDSIAGGDLTGTYANPNLASGSVGTGELGSLPAASLVTPISNYAAPNECGGTNSTFPSGDYRQIEFAVVKFDNAGLAHQPDPTKSCFNRFDVPVAGTYLITASVGWQPNAVGARKIAVFAQNPSGPCCALHASTEGPADSTTDTRQSTSGIAKLEVGAKVYLQGYQTSGVGLDFANSADSGLQIAWIGP